MAPGRAVGDVVLGRARAAAGHDEDGAQHVGPAGHFAAAGSVPVGSTRPGGSPAKAAGEVGEQSGAGRRRELAERSGRRLPAGTAGAPPAVGSPASSESTAGAGTLSRPCAVSISPSPSAGGEATHALRRQLVAGASRRR